MTIARLPVLATSFPTCMVVMVVFWGYALFPDRIGNFIAKPMVECNGAEIL